ncbi:aspartate carbamoyltransferase catalytic subunit [Exiguobacterium flavidum]|uniref:aspartate carbamoyltransferase catalytic subunit n=1 Tax=Exiguobacterium flavidum TaxID=2184695 RepID=UPI000DF85005|nr:aspartate carbamoyltransferase catalytic subunit [Exiguobacterium flavidum]
MKTKTKANFLTLEMFETIEIIELIDRAIELKHGARAMDLSDMTVANLFFENSTRTKCSFQMAEHRLRMKEIPFDVSTSSVQKGETLADTCRTLEAIGVDMLVVRHGETGYYEQLQNELNIPLINGGDGSGQHPSQSLLDLMTIRETFGQFTGLTVAICGDLAHSRVARSNVDALKRLGARVVGSGPVDWADPTLGIEHVGIDDAVEADVLMLLRVQHERHDGTMAFDPGDYHAAHGLTIARYGKLKDHAIVMHPAPINRGVEIASELVEYPKSRIFEQMTNGVYARMAILERAMRMKKEMEMGTSR